MKVLIAHLIGIGTVVLGLLLVCGHADAAQPVWFRILLGADQSSQTISHAAFRRGDEAILVFAADLPIGQDALRKITNLPAASVIHLPGATELRLPIGAEQAIGIQPEGSSFAVLPTALPNVDPIAAAMASGQLRFTVNNAGPVIPIADPRAGGPLLVGTVSDDAAFDQRLQGPGFATIPAWSGVVVAPASDELDLAAGKSGFALRARALTQALSIGNPPIAAASLVVPAGGGGELDLPRADLKTLRNTVDSAQRRFAAAPPSDRLSAGLYLARVILALDMGPEARGVLQALLNRDPGALNDPARRRLLAVADVIAHRPNQALANWPATALPDGDADLWRGLAEAEIAQTDAAASLIAQGLPHLLASPVLLRAGLASLAADTLVAGNQPVAAASLFASLPDDRELNLARAAALDAARHPHAALAAYSRLTHNADQRIAGIAQTRATLLRFQLHQIGARVAADALSREAYLWRSSRHELNVRLAMANLQATSGNWPKALTGLLRASRLFPRHQTRILLERHALFDQMVGSGALDRMEPLAAVAVIQNNTDLIPTGESGLPILRILARHLVALDLPEPAASIMRKLIPRVIDDVSRARLGLDLARIELASTHLKRAQAAIDTSATSDLPADLVTARALVAQEISARQMAKTPNAAFPASVQAPTLALVARLAIDQKDWPRAQAAFRQLATRELPPTGGLTVPQTRLVAQWASAAMQAGDPATLSRLRRLYAGRLRRGQAASLFDTITAPPLAPRTDLSAALRQIAAIERVDAALKTGTPALRDPPN